MKTHAISADASLIGLPVQLTDEDANPIGAVIGTLAGMRQRACDVRCADGSVVQVDRDSLDDLFVHDGVLYVFAGWLA